MEFLELEMGTADNRSGWRIGDLKMGSGLGILTIARDVHLVIVMNNFPERSAWGSE
jgi:hypothetical protein